MQHISADDYFELHESREELREVQSELPRNLRYCAECGCVWPRVELDDEGWCPNCREPEEKEGTNVE